MWLAFLDSEHAVTAIAACVEKKKINNLWADEEDLDITGDQPTPQTSSYLASMPSSQCGQWVRAVQTDLCSLKKNSSVSAHQKGKQPESSRTEAVVRRGNREAGVAEGPISVFGFSLDLNVHLSFENLDLAVAWLFCFPFHNSRLSSTSWPWRIYNPCTGSARSSTQSQKCIKPSLLGRKSKSVCRCMRVPYNCTERMK